jgi:hypothetical protein
VEEGVSDVTNGYAFSWDVVALFYKSAYYYKDVLIGTAVLFVGW